jgi:erlin
MKELIIPIVLIVGGLMLTGIHKVEEGHIGIYYSGGALLDGFTLPGFHIMNRLLSTVHNVQVNLQTDKVMDIPCGTAGGVTITFESIEVVNRLKLDLAHETIKNYTVNYDKTWIFDKIHHEINQFCSKHTLREVYITKFELLDESLKDAL